MHACIGVLSPLHVYCHVVSSLTLSPVAHAEADTFFCFTSLMTEIGDKFTKKLDTSLAGIGESNCKVCMYSVIVHHSALHTLYAGVLYVNYAALLLGGSLRGLMVLLKKQDKPLHDHLVSFSPSLCLFFFFSFLVSLSPPVSLISLLCSLYPLALPFPL